MLGWTRIFTLVAVAAVVAVVTGGAGATSTSTPAPGTASRAMTAAASRGALLRTANLNTLAGAARYLRAIGVDPRGLVIQRGARNYAGSSCPGAGWACTSTAHPVIQIAAAGGKNTFLCSTGSCAVVQTTAAAATRTTSSLAAATATNTAKCIKTTGLTQSCSISQNTSSGDNEAIVYENAFKNTGLTQTALVTAQITQTASGSNANKACVFQNVNIEGSSVEKKASPIVVSLNARQTISITQDSKTGGNTLASASTTSAGSCTGDRLLQTQTLLSKASGTGGSITQNENAGSSQPNVSLVIAQNQSAGYLNVASGANAAAFTQENKLTAIASKPAGAQGVNQTQSSTSGGIQAIVNQFSLTQSTIDAIQTETQCEDALTPPATLGVRHDGAGHIALPVVARAARAGAERHGLDPGWQLRKHVHDQANLDPEQRYGCKPDEHRRGRLRHVRELHGDSGYERQRRSNAQHADGVDRRHPDHLPSGNTCTRQRFRD